MIVYDATPSGLAPSDLAAAARREPAAARGALVRLVVGVVALVAAAFAPWGWLWLLAGLASVASTLTFARLSARLAVETPALVSEGRPSWGGVKRALFALRADDVDGVAARLVDALDGACGVGIAAVEGSDPGAPAEALAETDHGSILAWGVGRPPALRARGDTHGIWIRRRPAVQAEPTRIDVLVDLGEPEEALRRVAAGL